LVTEFNKGFDEAGIQVFHHMPESDGVYMKRIDVPAGVELHNHKHTFTHKSILAQGAARVTADGESKVVIGPAVMTIEKGVQHKVEALSDIVWFCIHASDETDPEKIDHTLVEENE
jgi:quercetin dioxygenase-like cupin family protein